MIQRVIQCGPELTHQGVELGTTFVDRFQLTGAIRVQGRQVARQLAGDLGHDYGCLGYRRGNCRQCRVVIGHALELPARGREHPDDVGRVI